jgi:UDP-GlcNAc:undecaprenyl-phosphate GlcNAc-1-phosphate transferase
MNSLGTYGIIALVGALVTLVCNPMARKIALAVNYCALPDERKVHQVVTPYGGGGAMFVGLCVALVVAVILPTSRAVIESS